MSDCCGGIDRDNPDVKDTELPYMIENCIEEENKWSRAKCNGSCCPNGGYCIPTEQGGFCHNSESNKYYRYGRDKPDGIKREIQYLYETDARRQYPYHHGESDEIFTRHGVHSFDDRRYDRSYAQAQRDIINKFMQNGILDQDTPYKRGTEYINESVFTPTTNVLILILVLVVAVSVINTVITRNKMYRLRKLFF